MIVYSRTLALFESAIKSPESKRNYTYSLNEFMKFIKIIDPDDIPKLGSEKILNFLKDWIIHLRNKQLKANTIRAKLCGIELLLEMNDILINKKSLHKLLPSSDYVPGGGTPFTTEEIQRMLKSTTRLRSKALVHFFASTGASGNPELLQHDDNGNGFVCVDETIKKNGKIKVKITDDDRGGATGCPPNCGR